MNEQSFFSHVSAGLLFHPDNREHEETDVSFHPDLNLPDYVNNLDRKVQIIDSDCNAFSLFLFIIEKTKKK